MKKMYKDISGMVKAKYGVSIPAPKVQKVMETFLEYTVSELEKGNRVFFKNWFSFRLKVSKELLLKSNYADGDVYVPARKRVKIKVSDALRKRLNKKE